MNPHKKDSIPFKDLSSTSEEGKKLDLNPVYSDLNLGIWRCEKHMKDSNPCKKDSNPIYRIELLAEDQAEGFESSSYRFKSPFCRCF